MKQTKDGLVIWQNRAGEADRVITLLTADGLVTAYARNSLLPRNKLTTPTAMLSYSNFELFPGKNMYTVDDASINRRFVRLFSDVAGNALAMYFCETLKFLAPEDDDASEFLSLMLNTLYALNEGRWSHAHIKSVFELKLVSLAGYMPDMDSCRLCETMDAVGFRFESLHGTYICDECAYASGLGINAPPSVLLAMRYILEESTARAFSFDIGETAQSSLSAITEQYIITNLERMPQTLEFYRTISS
jgi:DNA repair protein RecO (recombination protein O)